MKRSRRSIKWTAGKVIKLILLSAIIFAVLAGVVLMLQSKVETEFADDDEEEISSAQVTAGSISTTVASSGLLSDDDEEKQEIPSGLELEKIYVQAGERIEEGQLLATVKLNSVMTAMMSLNEEMDALDADINTASIETLNTFITSAVAGRVKEIYAQNGEAVTDVMAEHGALLVISLDGCLSVDIEAPSLSAGEAVTAVSAGGLSYPGKVEQVLDGIATVLLSDQGTMVGESVSILNAAGETLGGGVLKVNDPLKIMGYAGTVDYINVRDNSYVYSGSALMSLRDTQYTANYENLLKERADMEDELNELIAIYKEGAIYSRLSGTVKEINAQDEEDRENVSTSTTTASAGSSTTSGTGMTSGYAASSTASTATAADTGDGQEYFLISPDVTMSLSLSVDETDILSLDAGQTAIVSIDSLENESFEGTVTEIDRIGSSESGVTSYTATVTIPKSGAMLAGMSASATVNIEGVENALIIPLDALNKTASSYYVYTSYDEASGTMGGMREVSVGISNNDYVEIIEGLSEGETVYYREKEDEIVFSFGGMGGGMGRPMGGPMGGGMPGGMPPSGGMGGGMGGMR